MTRSETNYARFGLCCVFHSKCCKPIQALGSQSSLVSKTCCTESEARSGQKDQSSIANAGIPSIYSRLKQLNNGKRHAPVRCTASPSWGRACSLAMSASSAAALAPSPHA